MNEPQIIREIENALGAELQDFFTPDGQTALIELMDRHGEGAVQLAIRSIRERIGI
ncbi:hypothetical protein [Streptomyces sp. NPDC002402]